jgi:signal transduction histidine kinase
VAFVKLFSRLAPRTMERQMIAILGVSFAVLLAVLAVLEVLAQEDVVEWAQNDATLGRLRRMRPAAELIPADRLDDFLGVTSTCHEGYTVTDEPFGGLASSADTAAIAVRIAHELALDPARVRVGRARLTRDDFSYRKCGRSPIDLPASGIVISVALRSGAWLNAEVHPHEWHVRPDMIDWITRSIGAFLLVGAMAVFFVHRLARPLNELTGAARSFGRDLQVSEVAEAGPPDLRRAIRSFNAMQQQVTGELARRTHTLAAISHDVRTPLTALRIKTELVADDEARRDLISSIEVMERITASALEFLRGECRTEPMRVIDLSALLESECSDFEVAGGSVAFAGEPSVHYACRPDALACALRNLIDNALKYGHSAEVTLRTDPAFVAISVSDHGPGIPEHKRMLALEPFERLSQARESDQGGFGLGLAIARAIAEGHEGQLVLQSNEPTGLIATLQLPKPELSRQNK